jgi:hypothetical protein
MRRLISMFTLATGLLAGALAVPAAAQSGNLMTRVDGSFGNGGTFDGAVTLQRFETDGDRLLAVGSLDGTLTDAAGESLGEVRSQPVRLPVDRASLKATCDLVSARLGPLGVEAAGQRVELATVELEIAARASRAPRLRELLCRLAERLAAGEAPQALAGDLDRILAALG